MTIETCYQMLNGDYSEVIKRLPMKSMVERFALKFLQDSSYQDLVNALGNNQIEEAFRAAHTLKGVCANLSFTYLQKEASNVTEFLRAGNIEEAKDAFPDLENAYNKTIEALNRFKKEQENQ